MKIEIKKIILENYKCFEKMMEFNFFPRTNVSGKNASGKSTIQDSYFDVLTGKMADGTQPDNIRPHGMDGVNIDKVDCIREIHLEIDGKPVVIRKRTFQKWKKPRGQSNEVFDGNGVDYEVDGFPYKPEKFKEYMAGIVDIDKILLCENPNVFIATLKKSTAEARKLLEQLSGFSIGQFISENPQYSHIEDITKGHSVEETSKKLKKQLTDQKKKIEDQNTKIKYEKTRNSDAPRIEISDLELMKAEWRDKISELDTQEKQIDDSVKKYDELSTSIQSLKSQLQDMEDEANEENIERRRDVDFKLKKSRGKNIALLDDMKSFGFDLERTESSIRDLKGKIKKAQEDYTACQNRQFDESRLNAIMAEQFDENSLICPVCKRPFQEDMENQKRENFEKDKTNRILEQEKAREEFNLETKRILEEVLLNGNWASKQIEIAKSKKEELEKKIEEILKEIACISTEIERLEKEKQEIPASIDLSENEEYQSVKSKISEKEKQLSSLSNGSEKRSEIRRKRNEYMSEISKIDSRIQKAQSDQEEKERNVDRLESELRKMSQSAADIEKQLDMIMEFSQLKNAALAEKVNPYFSAFHFEFLEYTQEGNPMETCKLICRGTDYLRGLNYSDKILCDISLVCGLQKMNGLDLPVWVDNSESLNDYRLPDIEQQMIVLKVSEGELKVEEMRK